MTYTLNGIGTHLSGNRQLTKQECKNWLSNIPLKYAEQFYIATRSFVIFWLPLIPLETFVYYYSKEAGLFSSAEYVPCYYPAGKGKIYWKHVKDSFSFYVSAMLGLFLLIYLLMSSITLPVNVTASITGASTVQELYSNKNLTKEQFINVINDFSEKEAALIKEIISQNEFNKFQTKYAKLSGLNYAEMIELRDNYQSLLSTFEERVDLNEKFVDFLKIHRNNIAEVKWSDNLTITADERINQATQSFIAFKKFKDNLKKQTEVITKSIKENEPATTITQLDPPIIDIEKYEQRVFVLLNKERKKAGLSLLKWDDTLADFARGHSKQMAAHKSVQHEGFTQQTNTFEKKVQPLTNKGYDSIGENAGEHVLEILQWSDAYGNPVSREWKNFALLVNSTVNGYMTSPGHRANIMKLDFTLVGVGIAEAKEDASFYSTMLFGTKDNLASLTIQQYSDSNYNDAICARFNQLYRDAPSNDAILYFRNELKANGCLK